MGYNKEYDIFRPTDKYRIDKMQEYKKQNINNFYKNTAELWMREKLKKLKQETGISFKKQCLRGTRIFDFRCHKKGIALEVDGKSHLYGNQLQKDIKYDKFHEEYCGISVFRVRAFNDHDADLAIKSIILEKKRKERRENMGLPTSKERNRVRFYKYLYR